MVIGWQGFSSRNLRLPNPSLGGAELPSAERALRWGAADSGLLDFAGLETGDVHHPGVCVCGPVAENPLRIEGGGQRRRSRRSCGGRSCCGGQSRRGSDGRRRRGRRQRGLVTHRRDRCSRRRKWSRRDGRCCDRCSARPVGLVGAHDSAASPDVRPPANTTIAPTPTATPATATAMRATRPRVALRRVPMWRAVSVLLRRPLSPRSNVDGRPVRASVREQSATMARVRSDVPRLRLTSRPACPSPAQAGGGE